MSVDVAEVTENLRTMLRMNPKRFGIMVERQVQFALLPRLEGPRATLEPPLWDLLALLLGGPEAVAPALDDSAIESATSQARDGQARFPKSAAAVANALEALREHGVLPPPITGASEETG